MNHSFIQGQHHWWSLIGHRSKEVAAQVAYSVYENKIELSGVTFSYFLFFFLLFMSQLHQLYRGHHVVTIYCGSYHVHDMFLMYVIDAAAHWLLILPANRLSLWEEMLTAAIISELSEVSKKRRVSQDWAPLGKGVLGLIHQVGSSSCPAPSLRKQHWFQFSDSQQENYSSELLICCVSRLLKT